MSGHSKCLRNNWMENKRKVWKSKSQWFPEGWVPYTELSVQYICLVTMKCLKQLLLFTLILYFFCWILPNKTLLIVLKSLYMCTRMKVCCLSQKKSPQKEASSYNVNIVNCVLICLETNLINVLGMPIVNCFLSLLQRCKGVDLTWAQIKEQSIFGINWCRKYLVHYKERF